MLELGIVLIVVGALLWTASTVEHIKSRHRAARAIKRVMQG